MVREQPTVEEFDHTINWTATYRPERVRIVKDEIKRGVDYKVHAKYNSAEKIR